METSGSARTSISLDELVALTDEMAALVRAGVPLESRLAQTARDLARRPGKVAATISERMQSGESLQQVMADLPGVFSPAYRAVVEAGTRTGRLSAALEGLADSSQRTAEVRRVTCAAMIYPLLIAFMAYGLFIFSVMRFQPLVSETYTALDVPASQFNLKLVELGRTARIWGPALGLAALVLVGFWWYRSGRAAGGKLRWGWSPLEPLRQCGRIATFADVLALLIEQEAPLDQSVVLAAQASGDIGLIRASQGLSEEISRGGTGEALRQQLSGFPPLLGWLLAHASQQPATLAAALRGTADAYRRRAMRLDFWLRLYLPMALTVVIGGTAVVLYALSMFIPWYGMLIEAALHR